MELKNQKVFDLAHLILNTFDADKVKQQQLAEQEKLRNEEASKSGDKWDKLAKEIDREDKIEEILNTDYKKEQDDYMHKVIGCNKDHSREIDLYAKTYDGKMERIT